MAKSDGLNTPTSFPVSDSSMPVPPHLKPDAGIQSVVTEVQGEVAKNYDESWGDKYHGADHYPSKGSKGYGGGVN